MNTKKISKVIVPVLGLIGSAYLLTADFSPRESSKIVSLEQVLKSPSRFENKEISVRGFPKTYEDVSYIGDDKGFGSVYEPRELVSEIYVGSSMESESLEVRNGEEYLPYSVSEASREYKFDSSKEVNVKGVLKKTDNGYVLDTFD